MGKFIFDKYGRLVDSVSKAVKPRAMGVSFALHQHHVEWIAAESKKAGMKSSEFVRALLDAAMKVPDEEPKIEEPIVVGPDGKIKARRF